MMTASERWHRVASDRPATRCGMRIDGVTVPCALRRARFVRPVRIVQQANRWLPLSAIPDSRNCSDSRRSFRTYASAESKSQFRSRRAAEKNRPVSDIRRGPTFMSERSRISALCAASGSFATSYALSTTASIQTRARSSDRGSDPRLLLK